MIKESRGEAIYDHLVKKAKKDFNFKDNERWIQTRLRQLLIEEKADFEMLQIGTSVAEKNMKITSTTKISIGVEETMQADNEDENPKSILKCKTGKKSAKLSSKKVLFSDIIDIKYL